MLIIKLIAAVLILARRLFHPYQAGRGYILGQASQVAFRHTGQLGRAV